MEKIKSKSQMNKRGQIIELIGGTVIAVLVLIFIIFAVLFGISALNPASFFPIGTASNNLSNTAVTGLQNNLTSGVSQFGGYLPTVFIVLAIVLVMGALTILILYVRRMQDHTGGSSSGL